MKIWKMMGIIVISLALVSLVGCGKAEQEPEPETEITPEPAVTEEVAVDYVATAEEIGTEITCAACGMAMAVTADMPAVTYAGVNYWFCNADEKAEFVAAPEKFLKSEAVEEAVDEAQEKVEEATGN